MQLWILWDSNRHDWMDDLCRREQWWNKWKRLFLTSYIISSLFTKIRPKSHAQLKCFRFLFPYRLYVRERVFYCAKTVKYVHSHNNTMCYIHFISFIASYANSPIDFHRQMTTVRLFQLRLGIRVMSVIA